MDSYLLKPVCKGGESDINCKLLCFRKTIETFDSSSSDSEGILYSILSVLINEEYIFYQTFEEIFTNSQLAHLEKESSKNFLEQLFVVLKKLRKLKSFNS